MTTAAGRSSAGTRRVRRSALFIAGVIALLGVGYAAGSTIRSPAERLAEARPTAIVVKAPVEHRALLSQIELAGTARFGASSDFLARAPQAGVSVVVTRAGLRAGDVAQSGSLAVEVSGRPALLLSTAFPLYRDIFPGMKGPDVTQVQESLARLGYRTDPSGTYDGRTVAAVTRFYRDRGYEPPSASAELQAVSAAADSDLKAAQQDPTSSPASIGTKRANAAAAAFAASPGVLLSEILSSQSLPSEVVQTATVGAVLSPEKDLILKVASGGVTVRSRLTATEADQVTVGTTVHLVLPGTGEAADGAIAAVGPFEQGRQGDGSEGKPTVLPGREVEVRPASGFDVPAGAEVTIRIPLGADSAPGSVVPLTAIRESGTSHFVMLFAKGSGNARRVDVRVVRTSDGYALIEPVKGTIPLDSEVRVR